MDVDYLLIGAGASAMAFLDVLIHESDATVAVVDRRDGPGGHWNDAYPYVRLHQPSSFYGVNSTPLGRDRIDTTGHNTGLPEVASKHEILHYYQQLMERDYLPTGRVTYFRNSEHIGDGRIKSLVTGAETQLTVGKKTVNAGYWGNLGSIPSTHERNFEVDDGVTCIPPNNLPQNAAQHDRFCILGAGKTAMDAVIWLRDQSVALDAITWVRPRDYWVFQRDTVVPHADFFDSSVRSLLAEMESLATAETVEAHCLNMEACGKWARIDQTQWPTQFHAATCSRSEIEVLRQIEDVERAGRVTHLTATEMHLTGGTRAMAEGTLYIDCTASAGVKIDQTMQVFGPDTITVLMIRPFQPVFSAALIAHLEFGDYTDTTRRFATQVTNFHDTPAEYLKVQLQGFTNQYLWNQNTNLRSWIGNSRLDAGHHLSRGLIETDTDKFAKLKMIGPLTAQAVENIPKILANSAA